MALVVAGIGATWCEDCRQFGASCRCGVSAPIPDEPEPVGFAEPIRSGVTPPWGWTVRDLQREVKAYRNGSETAEDRLSWFGDPLDGLDALAAVYGRRVVHYGARADAAERMRVYGRAETVAGHVEATAKAERKAKREGRLVARVLDVRADDLGEAVAEAADGLAPWIVVPIGHPAGVACGVDRRVVSGFLASLRKARSVRWTLDLTVAREALVVEYTASHGQRGRGRFVVRPIPMDELDKAKALPGGKCEIPHAWIHPPA